MSGPFHTCAGPARATEGDGLEIKRSVLLPHRVEDMFDLIEQAERYPEFLPWCTGAVILERSDDWVAARLEFSYMKLRFGFQTRNPKRRPHWLQLRLVEGPFKRFLGDWHLVPLGGIGCRASLSLSFDVAEGRFDAVAGPAAERIARAMVDAFVMRAASTLPTLTATTEFAPAQDAPATPLHTAHAAAPAGMAPVAVATAPTPADEAVADDRPSSPPTPDRLDTPDTLEPAVTPVDLPLLEALRASPLAQYLTPEESAVLATVVRSDAFPAQAVLAHEGSSDNHLYVLLSGTLSVVKGVGTAEATVLATLAPGDFAHELGFLDGAERYAALQAATDLHVLVLEREGLESLVDSHPRVVYGVMRAIVRVVHRLQARMAMQASELTNYIVKQHGRY